jgi:hypothetical protein
MNSAQAFDDLDRLNPRPQRLGMKQRRRFAAIHRPPERPFGVDQRGLIDRVRDLGSLKIAARHGDSRNSDRKIFMDNNN